MKPVYKIPKNISNHLKCSSNVLDSNDLKIKVWSEIIPGKLWYRGMESKIFSSDYIGPFAFVAFKDNYYYASYVKEIQPIKCASLNAAMALLDTLALRQGFSVPDPYRRVQE